MTVLAARRGRTMRHRLVLAASVSLAVGLGALAHPALVAALACSGSDGGSSSFAGVVRTFTNDVDGAKANIEYFDEALCTTAGAADFSAFWAAVVGNPGINNIFQVGVDKCRNGPCVAGVPQNQSYYFWAYGRNLGPCGAAIGPEPHLAPLGNAGAGTKTYEVIREFTPGAGYSWRAKINGAVQWTKADADLNTCWNGVDRADFFNEVWDINAQSGGSNFNKQLFSAVNWNDDGVWNQISGSGNCTFHDLPTMICVWRGGNITWFSSDSRFP